MQSRKEFLQIFSPPYPRPMRDLRVEISWQEASEGQRRFANSETFSFFKKQKQSQGFQGRFIAMVFLFVRDFSVRDFSAVQVAAILIQSR